MKYVIIIAAFFAFATPAFGYSANKLSIRLLCIKHSREHMADGDADLAIKAAKNAASKGLDIKLIGNHFVDGKFMGEDYIHRVNSVETLTAYVKKYAKVDANPGDTLIVFTIGHGMPSGDLDKLGQRSGVMKILASIAEENNQKMFWWQLSCHACAKLPALDSLTEKQQDLFSMFASSSASETSAAYVQGKIMEKIFMTMAENMPKIDTNNDEKISASELRTFMNTINPAYGSRVFAKEDKPIFGKPGVPWLPIVDRNNPQGKYEEGYVFP